MAGGVTFLLYTTEIGGLLKFGNPKFFEAAKETGLLDVSGDVDSPGREYVEPKYVALVEVVDDFDFILGRPR